MNTKKYPSLCCGAAVLLALMPLACRAADAIPVQTDDRAISPPRYVLFTGTDVSVRYLGALHVVRGVEGNALIIQVDGRMVRIPIGAKPENLKVSQTVLLASRSAKVTKYKHDRGYTPANDPVRKWSHAMMATGEMNANAITAENKLRDTPETMVVREASPGNPMGEMKVVSNPNYEIAQNSAQATTARVSGNMGMMSTYAEKIAEEQALELYDALDVQFEVSAARPIRDPYIVVTATYHEKDQPQAVKKWLFAKALPPIDLDPAKVNIREAGFPPGFVVDNLQVHLYENGVEIATNLCENRAELTQEEAHEYLVLDYLSAHKGDTRQPQVALRNLPDDWAAHRDDEAFQKTYYVKVNKEGRSDGIFSDENCLITAPASYLVGVLHDLRFIPALKKGQPVEGVAPVIPARLVPKDRS